MLLGPDGALYVVAFLFCLALAVAWIVLPFAILGTKPLLRELLKEVRVTNELLVQQSQQNERAP